MARTRYGVTPWQGAAPQQKPNYPKLTERLDVPVAIVGGGLAGAAIAYGLAAAGVRVALLEADRIGYSPGSRSGGIVLQVPSVAFSDLADLHGRRTAKAIWAAWRRAALELSATIRRLNLRCGLDVRDAITWARTADNLKALTRELAARREAGLEGTWVTSRGLRALGIGGVGGIRTKGDAVLDPARLAQGLARSAAVRGAAVFERSPVGKISLIKNVTLHAARATVACQTVVIATGDAGTLFEPLARHFTACETYIVQTAPVPAPVRRAVKTSDLILQDSDRPRHQLTWSGDRIRWSGADQPTPPVRVRDKTLVQRTGQLMYELSLVIPEISGIQPELGWEASYSTAKDGLPFIGPHRNYPHHLFALGLGTNPAAAFLASRIIARHVTGASERADDAFGFVRLPR